MYFFFVFLHLTDKFPYNPPFPPKLAIGYYCFGSKARNSTDNLSRQVHGYSYFPKTNYYQTLIDNEIFEIVATYFYPDNQAKISIFEVELSFQGRSRRNLRRACRGTAIITENYLSSKQDTPGRSLPSRNSRDAPPPVEM